MRLAQTESTRYIFMDSLLEVLHWSRLANNINIYTEIQ